MKLEEIGNTTFQRIGSRYHYFDRDHFMGRSSMGNYGFLSPIKSVKKIKEKVDK